MNVLLVPAHPGFPGQIPQSRKTVVLCVSHGDTASLDLEVIAIDGQCMLMAIDCLLANNAQSNIIVKK